MKKTLRLIHLLFIIVGFSSLQIRGQGFLIQQVKILETRNATAKRYGDIDGSPYYTNKFIESVVYLRDGTYANLPLRLDLFQDQMEFTKDNNILWLKKNNVKYVRYGTDMIILSSPEGDTARLAYYFLKDDGKILLFYKKVIRYEPMVAPKGYADGIPERFVPDKNLIYIKKEKMPARKIVTKKDLTSFFSDDESALGFIKNKKVKPDDIEAIHQLVSFINNK
jgi:hypothetical protein